MKPRLRLSHCGLDEIVAIVHAEYGQKESAQEVNRASGNATRNFGVCLSCRRSPHCLAFCIFVLSGAASFLICILNELNRPFHFRSVFKAHKL